MRDGGDEETTPHGDDRVDDAPTRLQRAAAVEQRVESSEEGEHAHAEDEQGLHQVHQRLEGRVPEREEIVARFVEKLRHLEGDERHDERDPVEETVEQDGVGVEPDPEDRSDHGEEQARAAGEKNGGPLLVHPGDSLRSRLVACVG